MVLSHVLHDKDYLHLKWEVAAKTFLAEWVIFRLPDLSSTLERPQSRCICVADGVADGVAADADFGLLCELMHRRWGAVLTSRAKGRRSW